MKKPLRKIKKDDIIIAKKAIEINGQIITIVGKEYTVLDVLIYHFYIICENGDRYPICDDFDTYFTLKY